MLETQRNGEYKYRDYRIFVSPKKPKPNSVNVFLLAGSEPGHYALVGLLHLKQSADFGRRFGGLNTQISVLSYVAVPAGHS